MLNSPCYKCVDRADNCHSKCERYDKYKRALAERNKQIQEDKAQGSRFSVFLSRREAVRRAREEQN